MEWYIPMTIIPGIGLLILSTSNIMLSLNNEITQLNNQRDKRIDIIVKLKLAQLKKTKYHNCFPVHRSFVLPFIWNHKINVR